MTIDELNIFNNHPKRCNIKYHNVRKGKEYIQVEKVPYIDSTIHRNLCHFGQVGEHVIVTSEYVDKECGVLFVTFRCKDAWPGISMPAGMFGYYFRPTQSNKK